MSAPSRGSVMGRERRPSPAARVGVHSTSAYQFRYDHPNGVRQGEEVGMGELRPLELLMAADERKSAAERFAARMHQVRLDAGLEVPEDAATQPSGSLLLRVTPAMAAYLERLLEGQRGLEADTLRIALNLPLPADDEIVAGQKVSGQVHSLSSSLSTRTTRQGVHPYGPRGGRQVRVTMGLSRQSVELAA